MATIRSSHTVAPLPAEAGYIQCEWTVHRHKRCTTRATHSVFEFDYRQLMYYCSYHIQVVLDGWADTPF